MDLVQDHVQLRALVLEVLLILFVLEQYGKFRRSRNSGYGPVMEFSDYGD
jgi:hypothetical protein